jgi:hypothetical protein
MTKEYLQLQKLLKWKPYLYLSKDGIDIDMKLVFMKLKELKDVCGDKFKKIEHKDGYWNISGEIPTILKSNKVVSYKCKTEKEAFVKLWLEVKYQEACFII